MRFTLKSSRLALRNSTTRIPFRYGTACMTACPQAVLEAVIETQGGRIQSGFSGDCLPPGWFDKTPNVSYQQQIADMLAVAGLAQELFAAEAAKPTTLFDAWLAAYFRIMARSAEAGYQPLLASFGLSLIERAVMDALARAVDLSFAQAVRSNIYAIRPGEIQPELAGLQPAEWLPREPLRSVFVRHTVGLGDPLSTGDIPPQERLHDGFPQALEEYVQTTGTRYFKVKVSNRLDHDRQRLQHFAAVVERHLGDDYGLTLDGNEQYQRAEEFDALVEVLRSTPALQTLWHNTLAIEQPLARSIALAAEHTAGVRALGRHKPVIIDESDATLASYPQALAVGYRGVSSKNCKGPIKSLINAGLTWLRNGRGRREDYVMTAEDLCTVGMVPLQSDLCLVATLGLQHVERNGHHYHRGLSYLPQGEQAQVLAAHGDLYEMRDAIVAPAVRAGRFEIGSLHRAGFGFAVEPELDAMTPAQAWRYDSLGL
jgi:hypothetical protein